jgi:hypothetical protein
LTFFFGKKGAGETGGLGVIEMNFKLNRNDFIQNKGGDPDRFPFSRFTPIFKKKTTKDEKAK